MCFPAGDFLVGGGDVPVGAVGACPVYVEQRQLDAWPHTEIVIDVEPGYADGFSLAAGEGLHFVSSTSSCAQPATGTSAAEERRRSAR